MADARASEAAEAKAAVEAKAAEGAKATVVSWYDSGVRLPAYEVEAATAEVKKEAAPAAPAPPSSPGPVAEAERKLRIEIAALKAFPLNGDLPAIRARVEELSKPILDFESEMCTDVECSVLMLEFEEAMEGAMKARAAQLDQESAARRAAAKAEEEARVKERAKAISDSATRVFDFLGEVLEERAKEAEEARKREKAAAKAAAGGGREAKAEAEAKLVDATKAGVNEAAAKAGGAAGEQSTAPVTRPWWRRIFRRRRRWILFGRKLE